MSDDPPTDRFGQRHRALLPEARDLIADLEARRVTPRPEQQRGEPTTEQESDG